MAFNITPHYDSAHWVWSQSADPPFPGSAPVSQAEPLKMKFLALWTLKDLWRCSAEKYGWKGNLKTLHVKLCSANWVVYIKKCHKLPCLRPHVSSTIKKALNLAYFHRTPYTEPRIFFYTLNLTCKQASFWLMHGYCLYGMLFFACMFFIKIWGNVCMEYYILPVFCCC